MNVQDGPTQSDRASAAYRVGVALAVPGAIGATLLSVLALLGVVGVTLGSFRRAGLWWLYGGVYVALLTWVYVGPLFLVGTFVAAVRAQRSGDSPRRVRTMWYLAILGLAGWFFAAQNFVPRS